MASNLRTSSSFRKPNYEAANNAIDSVLAKSAFESRSSALKRSYKSAKQTYETTSRRTLARGSTYERGAEGLTGGVDAIKYANAQQEAAAKRLQEIQNRWVAAQEKAVPQWQADFNAKAKFQDLQGKQRERAWNEYVERQSKRLDVYKQVRQQQQIADSLGLTAKQSYSAYQRQQQQVEAQRAAYESMHKRSQQSMKRYEQALKKYNQHATYVPYRPA